MQTHPVSHVHCVHVCGCVCACVCVHNLHSTRQKGFPRVPYFPVLDKHRQRETGRGEGAEQCLAQHVLRNCKARNLYSAHEQIFCPTLTHYREIFAVHTRVLLGTATAPACNTSRAATVQQHHQPQSTRGKPEVAACPSYRRPVTRQRQAQPATATTSYNIKQQRAVHLSV